MNNIRLFIDIFQLYRKPRGMFNAAVIAWGKAFRFNPRQP